MNRYLKLLVIVVVCELVGIISTPFTLAAIPEWYSTLNKPAFAPPNWVFAPAWITLYFLMGVAAFLVLEQGTKKKNVKKALIYFSAQLFFNFLWSVLFFGLRSPPLGLVDILILWIFIFITMIKFHKIHKPAAYLLIPYLLWVSFAALLNFAILLLNL